MYWHEEQRTGAQWRATAYVLALHVAFLWLLAISSYTRITKQPPHKLVVRTVTLAPAAISPSPKRINTAPLQPETSVQPTIQESLQESPQEPLAIPQPAPQKLPPSPKPQPAPTPAPVSAPVPAPAPTPTPAPAVKKKPLPPKSKPRPAAKPVPKPKAPPVAKKSREKEAKAQQEKANQEKAKQEKAKQEKIQQEKRQQEKRKQEEAKKAAIISDALASLNRSKKVPLDTSKTASTFNARPSKIQSLSSDSLISIECEPQETLSPREKSYYDELVQRLRLSLKLPECHEVKLELTLARSGKVLRVKCIKSKSQKNIRYLETTVPTLVFPPFGNNFSNDKEHTFRIRLINSEITY